MRRRIVGDKIRESMGSLYRGRGQPGRVGSYKDSWKDSGFYSQWHRKSLEELSKKVTWFNLHFKMVTLTAVVSELKKRKKGGLL